MNGDSFNLGSLLKPSTLNRVLGGISQGLSLANKAIPIYKEIKPAFSIFKSLSKESVKTEKTAKKKSETISERNISPQTNNTPTFFA